MLSIQLLLPHHQVLIHGIGLRNGLSVVVMLLLLLQLVHLLLVINLVRVNCRGIRMLLWVLGSERGEADFQDIRDFEWTGFDVHPQIR